MSETRIENHKPFKALVTGGGGFLGRAITEQLLVRGDSVRVFSRGKYPDLSEMGVDCMQGDLFDRKSVIAACAGCDVVFHVAAKAGVWGKYYDYYKSNVVGTENIIAACREQSVGRLVFTSSPSVVFDGKSMKGVDESVPYPEQPQSNYSASKAAAERKVLAADGEKLSTIAIRPHLIWGPRDNHIVPRIIAQGKGGKLRIIGRGNNKVDTIYIDNAAYAHLLAADALVSNPRAAGKAYFVSQDEPIVVWDIINGILKAAGLPPVTRKIPKFAAISAGAVFELLHFALRRSGEPRMTRFVAKELATDHWFDISAAKRELNYTPKISIVDGLQKLEQWLRDSGKR